MRALIALVLIVSSLGGCPRKGKPPLEGTQETCFDKIDNDHDGKTDCEDEKCKPFCDGAQVY
jgi:hypothetical protein